MAGHAFGGRARARSLRRRVLRDRLMSDEVVPAAAGGLPYVSRPRTGTESRRRVARNRQISEQAVPATVGGWPRVSKPYTVTEPRRRVLHDRLISEAVDSRYGWRLAVCSEAAYGHGALAPRVARPADIGAVVSRYGWRLAVCFEARTATESPGAACCATGPYRKRPFPPAAGGRPTRARNPGDAYCAARPIHCAPVMSPHRKRKRRPKAPSICCGLSGKLIRTCDGYRHVLRPGCWCSNLRDR